MTGGALLSLFLDRVGLQEQPAIVDLFHAVRRIPYAVTGDRTARGVVERWSGSCSGKHVLLSSLIEDIGHTSRIVTVETTADRGLPEGVRVPTRVRELAVHGIVPDFHHYVQVQHRGQWVDLDATWDDSMEPYGFPVNRDSDASTSTRHAFEPIRIVSYSNAEELPALKSMLLEGLSATQLERREAFFRELTRWLEEDVRTATIASISDTRQIQSQGRSAHRGE